MRHSLSIRLCLYVTYFLSSASAFSFTFGTPTQCDPFSVSWSGGQAPFWILLAPFNQPQLNQSVPASAFSNGQGSYSIPQLPLASGSQFLLTMSDTTKFGSGGTTTILTVGAPVANNNCNTTNPQNFTFATSDTIQQCSGYTFSQYANASLPATITGLIPGGNSVVIYPVTTSNYTWVANVQEGTNMVFLMSDSQGGQGGVDDIKKVVNSTDASCLNANSPSSTSSAPSQTSTQMHTQPGNNTSTVTIIAGAVVGGVVLLVLLIILGIYCRRKALHSSDVTSSLDKKPRRLRRKVDGRKVVQGDPVTETSTQQTDPVSRPPLMQSGSQQHLRQVSYTDSLAGSPSRMSANTFPYQALPVGLAAPVHPGTHSYLTNTSVGDFVNNDSHAALGQLRSSRLSSNVDGLTGYEDARNSSVSPVSRQMPPLLQHMSADSFTVSDPSSPLSPAQASRQNSSIDDFRMHATASQILLPNRSFPHRASTATLGPSNQHGTLSHHPSASSFLFSDGSSQSNQAQMIRSSSVPLFGERTSMAAGSAATNPSAQIIRHTDMTDVPAVIELPPEYTERPFLVEDHAQVASAVAELAPMPNQKFAQP